MRAAGRGRALIEAVYRGADAAGADQVYWLTAQSNDDGAQSSTIAWGRLTPFMKYRR